MKNLAKQLEERERETVSFSRYSVLTSLSVAFWMSHDVELCWTNLSCYPMLYLAVSESKKNLTSRGEHAILGADTTSFPQCKTTQTQVFLVSFVCNDVINSVATPWVFSQDLGFFDRILGSWVFSDCLGFFLGFFQIAWVCLGFFHIVPENTLI